MEEVILVQELKQRLQQLANGPLISATTINRFSCARTEVGYRKDVIDLGDIKLFICVLPGRPAR